MRTAVHRRFFAAILLPLVAVSSVGPMLRLFRCTHGQTVHLAKCCPDRDDDEEAKEAAVDRERCCQQLSNVQLGAVELLRSGHEALSGDGVLSTVAPLATLARTPTAGPPAKVPHPGVGPPILLLKQSFLI